MNSLPKACRVACIIALAVAMNSPSAAGQLPDETVHKKYSGMNMKPVVQLSGDIHTVYHMENARNPILLLFHGCGHSATNFFPRSMDCPACEGLPEDVAITRAAVANKYTVIAFSSKNRDHKCWSVDDAPMTAKAYRKIKTELGLSIQSPVFGIGASSGGSFLLVLPFFIHFDAIAPQIASVPVGWDKFVWSYRHLTLPPTLFAHMPRDKKTASGIADTRKKMDSLGVMTNEVRMEPLQVSEFFFSDRMGINPLTSQLLYQSLLSGNWLDKDGYLTRDPRSGQWSSLVSQEVKHSMGPTMFLDALPQELNVAFAVHEISADPMPEILKFFEHAS